MDSYSLTDLPQELIEEIIIKRPEEVFVLHQVSRQLKNYTSDLFKAFKEELIKEYKRNPSRCLEHWAEKGDMNVIKFLISLGARNFDGPLAAAAKGGHWKLIEFFISKGADDFNEALAAAAKGGHWELVEFFIQKGAKRL